MIRNDRKTAYHIPVLLKETIDGLKIKPGEEYIDATLGGGGHTFEILKHGGIVLGIDIDQDAIDYVRNEFKVSHLIKKNLFLERGNFAALKRIAQKYGFTKVAGILFDLGVSSHQLRHKERGFSFKFDTPLDMRMDRGSQLSADYIVNNASREELYEIFTKFAEEVDSGSIARAIVRARAIRPIKTTHELVRIIESIKSRSDAIHQITRIFQALRIAVNSEIENLKQGLAGSSELLKEGGRLTVISFHSLEDRIVKLYLRRYKDLIMINKKPITPSREEQKNNPRSTSAKLRIFEKMSSI